MSSVESQFPRIFSVDKTHYMEAHPRLDLIYMYLSKGNKLLHIIPIDEVKEHLKKRNMIKEN